jgi:hypothetical protein
MKQKRNKERRGREKSKRQEAKKYRVCDPGVSLGNVFCCHIYTLFRK